MPIQTSATRPPPALIVPGAGGLGNPPGRRRRLSEGQPARATNLRSVRHLGGGHAVFVDSLRRHRYSWVQSRNQLRGKAAGGGLPLLEVKDLHTEFRTGAGIVRAVDGISYTVDPGETVAIVGESGSGKSVSALSILRLIPNPPGRITQGEVLLGGRNLMHLSDDEMRRVRGSDIGMVFQEPMTSLNPVLTIGRQITETVEQHRGADRAAATKRAVELLGLVGIADPARRLKQYPHQLSGGMRQRVMIAIALACDPKLIIADEPTTALDVTIQAQILELMKDLTRRLGVALIIITHNLGVVARYANRVNVMYAGRIVESGNAASIYHNPRHPYTMALLRSVPRLDRPRQARLDPVDGSPPDLTRLDAGCSFRPRCRFAVEACGVARPPLETVEEGGHLAACFRSREIAAAAGAAA
ncbi:MAG: ABC transporter ATP-binding protein [Alphaproteobacteria bacterium]|nr:ABC transporter ATP-binding protein [Alphaproteobacteria bacterium]